MGLLDEEKLEFLKTSVSWIEGRDIMESCFTLNFGYEAPLPWPQVYSHNMRNKEFLCFIRKANPWKFQNSAYFSL